MNTQKMQFAGLVLAMGLSSAAQAALESRLDGLAVYDTDLNITWLVNANLAATNSFGVSGIVPQSTNYPGGEMTWDTAQSWIGAMNAANYLGYNNWMLPTTLQPDASCYSQSGGVSSSHSCTGSMMGHLFYTELGGLANANISFFHNSSYSLFNNVRDSFYWSGTEYASDTSRAWFFDMGLGGQYHNPKNISPTDGWAINQFAWAVLPGDVALTCTDPTCAAAATVSPPASVPDPDTWGLMLSGLALVGWAARRRTAGKSAYPVSQ